MSRNNQSHSHSMTPWLADWILQEIRHRSPGTSTSAFISSTSTPHNEDGDDGAPSSPTGTRTPRTPRVMQILSRGGTFWSKTSSDENDSARKNDNDAWLILSDGQFSITAHLSPSCRQAIWQRVSTPSLPPQSSYIFLDYARGCCGLIQNYQLTFKLKPQRGEVDTNNTSNNDTFAFCLEDWGCKPGMKDLLFRNNNSLLIPPVDEDIHIRHELQQQQRTKEPSKQTPTICLGNVEDALGDPDLMETILGLAAAKEKDGDDGIPNNSSSTLNATATTKSDSSQQPQSQQQEEDDEEHKGDEQEEEVPNMSMRDMLRSPPTSQKSKEEKSQDMMVSSPEDAMMPLTQPLITTIQPLSPQQDATDVAIAVAAATATCSTPTSPEEERPLTQPPPAASLLATDATPTTTPTATPTRKRKTPTTRTLMTASGTKQPNSSNKKKKMQRTSYWQSALEQLADPAISIIRFAVDEFRPKELRHGLSRWLSKHTTTSTSSK